MSVLVRNLLELFIHGESAKPESTRTYGNCNLKFTYIIITNYVI